MWCNLKHSKLRIVEKRALFEDIPNFKVENLSIWPYRIAFPKRFLLFKKSNKTTLRFTAQGF